MTLLDLLGLLLGTAFVVGGTWMLSPPIALIVFGALIMLATLWPTRR